MATPVPEAPVLTSRGSNLELTDHLLKPIWQRNRLWLLGFLFSGMGTLFMLVCITYTVVSGIGVWGNNIPVAWAFAIINFVWWIGLGHAGTFISAFLLLLEQSWRNSINRIAEAMTLFAVLNAGLFPLLHLGRPWFFYWLIPYPERMGVWPQFRSALPWDAAAVFTYFTISLLFWYLGAVPDFAAARDRAPTRAKARIYGILAFGWRGSAHDWNRYRIAYGLLAGLATALVISVHSVVSMDFAISNLPGWHSTIFPPYFVVGAIYSGFAMVLMLIIPIRWMFKWEDVITIRHLETNAKMLLVMGQIMGYSYLVETFTAWYSGIDFERYMALTFRPFGWYAATYWAMLILNVGVPQLFWVRWCRRNPVVLFLAATAIFIGMWIERFVLIITSLSKDFLPSSWAIYHPTWVDWGILLGTLAFFTFNFLLFLKFVPPIPIHEVKELRHSMREGEA